MKTKVHNSLEGELLGVSIYTDDGRELYLKVSDIELLFTGCDNIHTNIYALTDKFRKSINRPKPGTVADINPITGKRRMGRPRKEVPQTTTQIIYNCGSCGYQAVSSEELEKHIAEKHQTTEDNI